MAEEKETSKRSKPKFLRNDWHKKIKLGSTVKKNRKWRAAKGIHNKLRLNRKGHQQRPKVGWGENSANKGKVQSFEVVRVENVRDLSKIKTGMAAMIASVGKKKREEILTKAKEMNVNVLNKYKERQVPKKE